MRIGFFFAIFLAGFFCLPVPAPSVIFSVVIDPAIPVLHNILFVALLALAGPSIFHLWVFVKSAKLLLNATLKTSFHAAKTS